MEYGWNVVDKKKKMKPVDFSEILNKPQESANVITKKETKNKKKKNKTKNKTHKYDSKSNYYDYSSGYDQYHYEDNYYYDDKNSQNSKKYQRYVDNYNHTNYNYGYTSYYNKSYPSNYYNKDNYYYYYPDRSSNNYSYYDYYDNYYYSQGYYDNKQSTKRFKKKKRPNNYREEYNGNNNYYQRNYYEYSTNYQENEGKNNKKNFRVVIKDLSDNDNFGLFKKDKLQDISAKEFITQEDISDQILIIERKSSNSGSKNEEVIKGTNHSKNLVKIQSMADKKSQSEVTEILPDNKEGGISENNTTENCVEKSEAINEIEEINVNKVDIENLRSYFDKFKHFTIFNEPTNNQSNDKKHTRPFYDQFNNFKASSAMIRSLMANQGASNIFAKDINEGEKEDNVIKRNKTIEKTEMMPTLDKTVPQSKKLTNLSINSNILEISSANRIEDEYDGKKIHNFSLFISGTDKAKKQEDAPSTGKFNANETKNVQTNYLVQNHILSPLINPPQNTQTQTPNSYIPNPNYPNMINSQPINPYIQYEPQSVYPNMQNRWSYEPGHYNQDYMTTPPNDAYQYEYPPYQYYGMPYRFNNIQYPAYQNFQVAGHPAGYMGKYKFNYLIR